MNLLRKFKGLLNRLISQGHWYNESKFRGCRKFWTYKTFNTEIVNLGSTSGVNAFCYDDIPHKCANWALESNPLKGDLAILRNYYSYLSENASTVILTLCPFSSLSGGYNITEDRYYSLLYPSSIPLYSICRQQQIKKEVNNPLCCYPVIAIFTDLKALIKGKRKCSLTETQMQADAKNWITNWMKEFSIIDFSYPLSMVNCDGIEEAAKIINEVVTFCKERNIRPVLAIPPVYHTLGEMFTPEIRKKVIDSLIERIDDKYVWYHNYMDDPEFTNDISLFQNSYLMNRKGAKLFTHRVLMDIGLVNDGKQS